LRGVFEGLGDYALLKLTKIKSYCILPNEGSPNLKELCNVGLNGSFSNSKPFGS
jgi:hypothetical protein